MVGDSVDQSLVICSVPSSCGRGDLLITHHTHNIIPIRDKPNTNRQSNNSNLPKRHISLRADRLTRIPSRIHRRPNTNSISDIIRPVRERCSTSCDNLYERVEVFDFVGVFWCVVVDTVHAFSFGGAEDSELGGVDVVVETVGEGDDDHGGEAVGEGFHVVEFVDGAGAWGVVVEAALQVVLVSGFGSGEYAGLTIAQPKGPFFVRRVAWCFLRASMSCCL